MDYAHSGFFTTAPAEELAALILGETEALSHVLFVSSGSEAMEAALKLARQFHIERGEIARTHFIGRRQSYHGATLATLAVGGHRARRAPYLPLFADNFSHVSPCFAFRHRLDGESDASYVAGLAAELDAAFERVGPERVAAFCAETVVGATTGCVAAVPGYFPAMRAICDKHGALLILDEVMSGMGRTGYGHAWEAEGVVPDIQAIGKGLGGGYQPIGAVLVAPHIVDALTAGSGGFMHGQTYQAHPVACAGALEVQRIIREDRLVANAARLGKKLGEGLQSALGSHPQVGDVRGRGLFWGIEFVRDRATKEPFPTIDLVSEKAKDAALRCGLLVYPGAGTADGERGDHVLLAPAFNMRDEDIDEVVGRLERAVASVFR